MLRCNDDSELRRAPEAPVLAPFSPGGAGVAGQRAISADARAIAGAVPGWGNYRAEIFTRRQDLLREIDTQNSHSSLSADEQDYLSRMSSTISGLDLESIASIDVLKLCIVCARFYPRIDILRPLAALKAAIEAPFLKAN